MKRSIYSMVINAKNRLKASSIIEVVMAMTIIAIVVAIGAIMYVNINQSNSSLKEINEEGEALTDFINQRLILNETVEEKEFSISKLTVEESENREFSSLIYQLRGRNNNVLWQFEVMTNEEEK